ncbi:hypothetical protein TorRG33x02_358320 [Trema orientale]|uniref:Uncharacterized protein n=1 Tax=Trema orientale TaxID=63057 RepID=A0A2P5A3Z1_TREOI|nr:hypothetical protein TorRG33x02_358320 [Trema orientale]
MGLSMSTRLENRHTEPIVVRAKKNGFPIDEFNVTIQPGTSVHVYYSDLGIEYNYSQPHVLAFPEGQENQGQTVVLTSAVRSSEVIVFGFENGLVTVKPIKGKFLPRIG